MPGGIYEVKFRERRLCIVLLDIIGSTAFVQRYGARRAARHFQKHDRLARRLIYKYNGREIDRSDGFLCSFDYVMDAINFGLSYQEKIPQQTGLQCRIGIHWGLVVEVHQDELFVAANAKKIELEGLSKNIAARTMSVCGPGQVLLTEEAYKASRGRVTRHTPKGTGYACVGLYKFKGVRQPQVLYAVGVSTASLQPPPSTEKVKRLGGPKYIKRRLRDRQLKEVVAWLFWRLGLMYLVVVAYYIWPFFFSSQDTSRWIAYIVSLLTWPFKGDHH